MSDFSIMTMDLFCAIQANKPSLTLDAARMPRIHTANNEDSLYLEPLT
jgi:hypothetical protein